MRFIRWRKPKAKLKTKTKKQLINILHYYSRRERVEVIRIYKGLIPCHDCRHTFPWQCMTFDHLDRGSKIDDVMSMVKRSSLATLIAEIQKCDVVCLNCHAIREAKRDTQPATEAYIKRKMHTGMKLG